MRPSVEISVIEAAQQGDHDAFAVIYNSFFKYLRAIACESLREQKCNYLKQTRHTDVSKAEDLTQDSFCAAFKAINRFDIDKPLAPWLCTIVINSCRNYIRDKPKGIINDLDEEEELGDIREFSNPEKVFINKEIREGVNKALLELSDRRKEIVSLRLISDLTCSEIATQMQIPMCIVKNELHRGKIQMREYLVAYR